MTRTSETQSRIKDLDTRLQSAVVELESEKDGIYRVFVPGAIREETRVKAESRKEAVEKVRSVLVQKIDHRAEKKVTGGNDGTLEVKNAKQGNKSQDVGGSNG